MAENPVLKFPGEYIEKYDTINILSQIRSMPRQLKKGYELAQDIEFHDRFTNFVVLGMGGSFGGAMFLKAYLGTDTIQLNNGYELPDVAGKKTLVIATSYSGNTEETLSATRKAIRAGSTIVAQTTGGKMRDLAKKSKLQMVKLEPGYQPRLTLGFQLGSLLGIMEKAGVVRNASGEIKRASNALGKDIFTGTAMKISGKLHERIPVIYSSKRFYPVAYRWKTLINENSKAMAFANELPEQNHNEIMGFVNAKQEGNFHIIMLRTEDDLPRIQKRMKLTKEIAQDNGLDVSELGIKGNTFLTRLLTGAMLGDLTSYYLALRYRKDPANVDTIEYLKKQLGPFV